MAATPTPSAQATHSWFRWCRGRGHVHSYNRAIGVGRA